MSPNRAKALLGKFSGRRVVVVGDVMVDEYIFGQATRISPEAPVMVVEAERYDSVPGGAANVVNNLCALGGTGVVVGVVGNDADAGILAEKLRAEGAETSGLVAVEDRPTTRKTRIVAHSQQVVRVDHEKRHALPAEAVGRLLALLDDLVPGADAVLLSDYQKGVLVPEVLDRCIELALRHKKPITGNLKPVLLGGPCRMTVITLNLTEAAQALAAGAAGTGPLDTDAKLLAAGRALLERTGAEHVLITRGEQGLSLFSRTRPDRPDFIAAHRVAVYDVAGAGDTVISTLTLALAAGADPVEAVSLANYAAAEAVKKVGVATVSADEIIAALEADHAHSN